MRPAWFLSLAALGVACTPQPKTSTAPEHTPTVAPALAAPVVAPLAIGDVVPDLTALRQGPSSELREVVERYADDHRVLRRRYDVQGSPDRTARLRAFYDEWDRAVDGIPFEDLGLEGRVDWILLHYELRARRSKLEREAKRHADASALLPGIDAVLTLMDLRRRRIRAEPQEAAQVLDQFGRGLEEVRKALKRGQAKSAPQDPKPGDVEGKPTADDGPRLQPSLALAYRATKIAERLRRDLEGWNRYYSGYDPTFAWWTQHPYEALDASLQAHIKTLREDILGEKEGKDPPVVGDPVGKDALEEQLRDSMVAYSPGALIKLAEKELAWCEEQIRLAAAAMGHGDDWRAALEEVKQMHVGPGEQPEVVRALAEEATQFVESRDLLTVPELAKEVWRVRMMTPERQKVTPFFTGGEVVSVSFPTDTMSHEEKRMSMRGNNIPFSRATVHHELIPGHHLQLFMIERHQPQRRAFRTPFWIEGWALYWEMRLWDLGFPRTPQERVGMLFWRMHRCARVIFSLRFHLGEMTAPEAIEFLVTRIGHEPENAEGEVRRSFAGDYPPLYQLAYLTGGLQIRALHQEMVVKGNMQEKAFHDAILRGGPIPIELVRARLRAEAPPRDFEPSWRFGG